MSDVDNIMASDEAYYDPSQDIPMLIPEGKYKANALELSKREVKVRNQFLADVYDIMFEVSEDNKGESVESDGKEVDKGSFSGRKLKSKGFFRFKKPDPSNADHAGLEENSRSNKSYLELLDSFQIKTEADNEGKFLLPNINESDISGMPVIIDVVHESWTNKQGEEKVSAKAQSIFIWEGAERKEEELPF